MPARRHLAAGLAAFLAFAGVTVVSAGAVDEPARVDFRAWRVDPPEYIRDPDTRVRVEMLGIVNEVRKDGAMPGVQLHDQVTAAAQAHAEYLASIRRLSHFGPNNTNTGHRLHEAGFGWIAWGENVGAGFHDAQLLVDTWLESSSHRAQLLGDYRYAGVGVAATPDGVPYWVLVLAS